MYCNQKRLKILLVLLLIINGVYSQKKRPSLLLRIPIQTENQKAVILSYNKLIKATTVNYGAEVLLSIPTPLPKLSLGFGLGYFRNRVSLTRPYDHSLLNANDSIPINTETANYIYHLLRIPVSLNYAIKISKNYYLHAGCDYIAGFTFSNQYNGGLPFPNANTTLHEFGFYSNTVNISALISFKIKNSSELGIGPYCRVLYTYKGDRILYENPNEVLTSYFDAWGVYLTYSINL